ncbi:GH3 auxin-responsive promoter family protein [Streptomyces sp. NBC_00320]|uniref:GH3 auxin-responsive promoter family protein n=1 Tax=Streptomyces sp. NBC_00320 TaxID=2975711 RepID=UPI002255F07E|nr:GH3 auxin-responsive promoter family protein [Streptomyces sp. NBC_00320]MCX5150874.1 GH3 auxin-responsive promoter family protein [Streptomyces sp. NBC_00320]
MSAGEWTNPDRLRRYRERVLDEQRILREACGDADGHRQRVLEDMLAFNADTEFGKKHGFRQIRDLDDFRKAVPIADYAALEPWIERMAAGESGLLTADDPALYFTSSGTTGAHKKIPVTPRFVQTVFMPFYYAMWAPMAEHFWDVVARPDAVLNLKQDVLTTPRTTASGRPHLGSSQVDFGAVFGETLAAEPGTSAPWAELPSFVPEDDHTERQYLRLRLAVENRDLQGIVAFNPAMIAALPHQLGQWWPRILKDIHDGTLGGRPHHSPNPRRAAVLEQLARYHPTIRPSLVWPRMKVILSWTTGVSSLYLHRVREEFGAGVTLLPAPVGASEGPVGVALDRHSAAGSLVVTAAVHEFVDADADLGPDSQTLLPHEIEANRDYHVVFSHVGGLYRYALGDVVRVLDHADGVPRLEYVGRSTLSNAVGERLRDGQVVRALRDALAATGLEVRNAACRVAATGGTEPYYTFAVEPRTAWSDHETSRFARLLDTSLCGESADYRRVRAEGRLDAASVLRLPEGAFQRQWDATVASGVRFTQVKDRLFRQDDAQWQRLTGDTPHGH